MNIFPHYFKNSHRFHQNIPIEKALPQNLTQIVKIPINMGKVPTEEKHSKLQLGKHGQDCKTFAKYHTFN